MDGLSYVCALFLCSGIWNAFYENHFKRVPGLSTYDTKIYNSYRLSTTNAVVTTWLAFLWTLGVPHADTAGGVSLAAYFYVDLTTTPIEYWKRHKDQVFHHILCFTSATMYVMMGGKYLEFGTKYSLFAEISTLFCNMRWFMLKRFINTDPVVFMLNKTAFIVSYFAVRVVYFGVVTLEMWHDTNTHVAPKYLALMFYCLNLFWSFHVYKLMPLVVQMTLLSLSVSTYCMFFLDSPLGNRLAKFEFLVAVVSAIYWSKPQAGWRRNLDMFVTLSVFGLHAVVCFYLQQWVTIFSFLVCIFSWYMGHVFNSNSWHLGVHFFGCAGICYMHFENVQASR